MLSPETLPGHELIGLSVRVSDSTDPTRIGIEGRVVDETTNTLLVETADSGVKQVPKAGARFTFAPIDEAATSAKDVGSVVEPAAVAGTAGEATASVTVDGALLLSRPARRTTPGVGTQWR